MNEWLVGRYASSRGSVRRLIQKYVTDSEGGQNYSTSLREIYRRYYGVEIGLYTMGGCFVPYAFGRNTVIGRYTSVAMTAFAATDNHPMHHKSMHGFFFNPELGLVDRDSEFIPLEIGNDVWLGHNSIIMPEVATIGDGAVVAAGAVVNKNVPPYAVVVGNPARVVRYRFDPETIGNLLAERWWEKDISELREHLSDFTEAHGAAGATEAILEAPPPVPGPVPDGS
jgi:acetyltransferase-like isoleucine patch superfamily enzyme